MSSTVTHFTKPFPKQADIMGSPEQAFNMQDAVKNISRMF
jgi:hypothetical protein